MKKKAIVKVVCLYDYKGNKEEVLSEKIIDLSLYIGRGTINDKIQMSGAVSFIDYEITIENIKLDVE